MKREFAVLDLTDSRLVFGWAVTWKECDGRVVAYCDKKREAAEIARLLNASNTAKKWYKHARVAIAVSQMEGR